MRKLALLAMVLACLVPGVRTEAGPDPGAPGSETSATDGFTPAPATTPWGMYVMMLLVLTASTAALLGGDLFPRRAFQAAEPGPSRGVSPAADIASEAPDAEPAAVRRDRAASPKNKSKRVFSRQRHRQEPPRKGWNVVRRDAQTPGSRRRGGPGCRGVR